MTEEIRLGVRMLWRRRHAALLTVTLLALGIGLATSTWSLLDGVLLRGLPFPEGDRVALVSTGASIGHPTPVEDFDALRERQHVFEDLGAFRTYNSVIRRPGAGSKGFTATYVTGNLFGLLGAEPILGRDFTLADEDPATPPVAILSHHVWTTQFGSDPEIVGKTAVLNREPMTVVGVMPAGFHFPIRQDAWAAWRPAGRAWSEDPAWVVARLRPGQNPARAALELAPRIAELDAERPLAEPRQVHVRGFVEALVPEAAQRSLKILLAAALGVLLIACANTANLRLGDTLAREHELVIRRTLGAGTWRLLRQQVVETAVLVAAAATLGLALAWSLVRLAAGALLDGSLLAHQFWIDVRLDGRAAVFAVATCALAVFLSGLLPALWSLRRGASALGRRATGGRDESRLALGLVSAEVAVCFTLAVGAGLLLASSSALVSPAPAFDERGLMRTVVNTFQTEAETPAARRALWERLLPELRADPAIAGATLASSVPWLPGDAGIGIRADPADERPSGELPRAQAIQVLPGYFEALRWPLLAGRELERRDVLAREEGSSERLAAVVSAAFARRHFDGQAVGRTFRVEVTRRGEVRSALAEVVGMVADRGLGRTDQPFSEDLVFTPYAFRSSGDFLIVRGQSPGQNPMAAIDRRISRLAPLAATLDERTYGQERARETWTERRLAQLLAILAAASLVLSAIGLYGVVALSLRRRRRELAIRSALGALPRALRALLFGQGGRSVGLGLAIGAVLTWWSGRFLERFLYQVGLWDPRVVGGAVLAVTAAALVALLGPARSAGRTDPAKVLRSE